MSEFEGLRFPTPFKYPLVDIGLKRNGVPGFRQDLLGFQNDPEKVVRVREEMADEIQENKYFARPNFLSHLTERYGLQVPGFNTVIVTNGRLTDYYTVTDMIHGATLQQLVGSQVDFPVDVFDHNYAALVQHYIDAERFHEPYAISITNPAEMLMYGRRKGESEDSVYLVDIDIPFLVISAGIPTGDRWEGRLSTSIRRFSQGLSRFMSVFPETHKALRRYLNAIPKDSIHYPYGRDLLREINRWAK